MKKQMKKKEKPEKPKRNYSSPEARARQLAGLACVPVPEGVEKVNGQGLFASVPEDVRKQIIDLYCQGLSVRAIAEKVNLSKSTVDAVKLHFLDHDSQFREKMFQQSIKQKLQTIADVAADRVTDLMPEMQARDAILALGVAADKLMLIERTKNVEQLHQHVHLHAPAELNDQFMKALQPKNENQQS
jgi:hypothetical protein